MIDMSLIEAIGQQRALTDPAILDACARDFGCVATGLPALVVDALTEDDVAAALRAARAHGVPISIRGAGHSFGGQSLCPGGIVVRNVLDAPSQMRPHLEADGRTTLEVSGRTTWRAVEEGLASTDGMVPVLTSELSTTVAGTLSAGGYGIRSIRFGAQVDHVRRLRLLLPDATPIFCTEEENAELFRCALGGYGQAGVIESAWFDMVPRPKKMTLKKLLFANPTMLMRHIEGLRYGSEIEADHFCAHMTHEESFAIYARSVYDDGDGAPYTPMALTPPLEARRNLWADHAFTHEAACAFVDHALTHLGDPFLRQHLERIYVLCLRRPLHAGGLFDIRNLATDDACVFGVGLYFSVFNDDAHGLARVQKAFADLKERAIALGGRPYLQGSHSLDRAALEALHPEAMARLRVLREQNDPDHLLNRGALFPWEAQQR